MKHCIPKGAKMASRSKHPEGVEKSIHHPGKGTLSTLTSVASLLLWLNMKIAYQFDIELIKLQRKKVPYIIEKDMNGDEEECGKYICVGSQLEGTSINVSDTDVMYCLNDYVCYDLNSRDIVEFNDKQYNLIADRRFASNGYTLLWDVNDYVPKMAAVKKIFWKPPDIVTNKVKSNVFVQYGKKRKAVQFNKTIVDHSIINKFAHYNNPCMQIHGPAVSVSIQLQIKNRALVEQLCNVFPSYFKASDGDLTITAGRDEVLACRFISKDIPERWARRKRRYGWPPNNLITEVCHLPGHVVCTGRKGSKYERYEWRISYTLAECKLVRSLNEVQILMIIYLKYFFGVSEFKDCTSYEIKNVILWLSESVQPSYFRRENFLPLLLSTLTVISWCIEKKCLPNYMIPERNLFEGKFDDIQFRQQIISRLKSHISSNIVSDFKPNETRMIDLVKQLRIDDKAVIAKHQKTVMNLKTSLCILKYMADNKPLYRFVLFAMQMAGCTACLTPVFPKFAS